MTGELLIDTSTLIDFFEDNIASETEELMINSELALSVATFTELYKFLLNNGKNALWSEYKRKLSAYRVLEVDQNISEKAAELSHRFGFSFADSVIYATALSNGLKLLTSDSDFKGKPNVILGKKNSKIKRKEKNKEK
ncbi:MAG: PIN domain-containing protein [Candidatus Micrarchaeota archaeon]